MNRIPGQTALSFLLCALLLCGCNSKNTSAEADHSGPKRDNTPQVLSPTADHIDIYETDAALIDVSNRSQGYITADYHGDCDKVKLQITGPDQNCYTYLITEYGSDVCFPLTAGSGSYSLQLLEHVDGDSYALTLAQDIEAEIADEFLPFLYPNQYVDFCAESAAVQKGQELAADTWSDLEVVQNIYDYVIQNISYDTAKAESVSYGYLPDVDETLSNQSGICFDYAALMTAMLRSQGIPTRLEVGYSGDAYHAWISTYVDDKGWVNNIIEFDGDSWQIMDPTLGANNDSASVKEYIGDGSHYVVKYTY